MSTHIITVVDLLDAGACLEGLKKWIVRNGGVIVGDASLAADAESREWANKAAGAVASNGYGYCTGDGDGNGYGYG